MHSLTLFNHKGGVGKTTLTINIANALADLGQRVLIVDSDPQCNISAFYIDEPSLDAMLGESEGASASGTVWSAIEPVVHGTGDIREIIPKKVGDTVWLAPGDVLLADYEEELPAAWTDSFARKPRGYHVTSSLFRMTGQLASKLRADIVLYDVGPNVGALNRSILLSSDYFITPVAADLFSLRALTTVGRAISRWVTDWRTVLSLASEEAKKTLPSGQPKYLGYISSAFKVSSGLRKANPHSYWEAKIAPRVKTRVVDELRKVDQRLVLLKASNKVGDVKHFHSLAASAQDIGLPIGELRGHVNSGHYPQVDEAKKEFAALGKEILRRIAL